MDSLTVALAFSNIVSLLGTFRSQRGVNEKADFNEFLEWLVKTNHDDIKELLESNTKIVNGIKKLLDLQWEELISKLELIDNRLASYASVLPEFFDLSSGLKPESLLSEQAINILKQFTFSDASEVLEDIEINSLIYLDARGEIKINQPRFLLDDMRTLVDLGLLRCRLNKRGDNIYILTRAASELVQSKNS